MYALRLLAYHTLRDSGRDRAMKRITNYSKIVFIGSASSKAFS